MGGSLVKCQRKMLKHPTGRLGFAGVLRALCVRFGCLGSHGLARHSSEDYTFTEEETNLAFLEVTEDFHSTSVSILFQVRQRVS